MLTSDHSLIIGVGSILLLAIGSVVLIPATAGTVVPAAIAGIGALCGFHGYNNPANPQPPVTPK